MKVAIIGAGASGLMTAININNSEVTIFEKLNTSAKKILATGNGKCNYYNDVQNIDNYDTENKEFISDILTENNLKEVLNIFNKLGIIPYIKNGYYYPNSREATSIRNTLLKECLNKNVKIVNNYNVNKIEVINDKFKIDNMIFDKLVISGGSNAYYKEETNIYDIAKSLGHNVIEPKPCLTSLITKEKYDWQGIRVNSKVKLLIDNKIVKEEKGELQLTNYGLSGICIFNLSYDAIKNIDKDVSVEIDFLDEINDLSTLLEERNKIMSERNILEFLEGLLNEKLIKVILNRLNISEKEKYNNLNNDTKNRLIDCIKNFKVKVIDYKGYEFAQSALGGVDTKEIKNTMESKKVKNLYFTGEILDVCGKCGGYNLTFAWLSGYLCGRTISDD